jgi:hypothetical protein
MQSTRRTLEASMAPPVTTQAATWGKESGGRADATAAARAGGGLDGGGARVRQRGGVARWRTRVGWSGVVAFVGSSRFGSTRRRAWLLGCKIVGKRAGGAASGLSCWSLQARFFSPTRPPLWPACLERNSEILHSIFGKVGRFNQPYVVCDLLAPHLLSWLARSFLSRRASEMVGRSGR